jgi:hypothetical protein
MHTIAADSSRCHCLAAHAAVIMNMPLASRTCCLAAASSPGLVYVALFHCTCLGVCVHTANGCLVPDLAAATLRFLFGCKWPFSLSRGYADEIPWVKLLMYEWKSRPAPCWLLG